MSNDPKVDDIQAFIRFPPFPSPPPGVQITPFKEFKPAGIRIQLNPTDDAHEVDGLGIPTIELRVKHETDEPKTGAGGKRKKKKRKAADGNEPLRKKTWWEVWEDAEDLRITSENYDMSTPVIDRFVRVAEDFKRGRSWPPQTLGINILWDAFRLYTGLLSNQAVFRKAKNSHEADANAGPDAFCSDDEDEFGSTPPIDAAEEQLMQPQADATPALHQENDVIEDERDDSEDARDVKMNAFLDDPELSMKIFFSSHMRDRGLIWSPQNLTNMPRLLSFFLNFILRNRVLPAQAPAIERGLQVVAQAALELPLTAKVGQVLPDELSEACMEAWGAKSRSLFVWEGESNGAGVAVEPTPTVSSADMHHEEEGQDRKRRKKSDPEDEDDALKVKEFEEQLKSGNLALIDPNAEAVLGQAKEVAEDAGMDVDNGGWGDSGGWGGTPSADAGGWGSWSQPSDEKKENDLEAQEDNPWTQRPTVDGWAPPVVRSLTDFLGPTSLPLTHETGVVEWSLRRVKAILPPLDAAWKKHDAKKGKGKGKKGKTTEGAEEEKKPTWSGKEGSEAVEEEMERRFGRLVLEPWLGWDKDSESDISQPNILPSSRASEDGHGKKHDPHKDEIVVLLKPDVASSGTLCIGMGLGATWVQIAKKTESAKKSGNGDFWYMEQLMAIFPSYYMQPDSAP